MLDVTFLVIEPNGTNVGSGSIARALGRGAEAEANTQPRFSTKSNRYYTRARKRPSGGSSSRTEQTDSWNLCLHSRPEHPALSLDPPHPPHAHTILQGWGWMGWGVGRGWGRKAGVGGTKWGLPKQQSQTPNFLCQTRNILCRAPTFRSRIAPNS